MNLLKAPTDCKSHITLLSDSSKHWRARRAAKINCQTISTIKVATPTNSDSCNTVSDSSQLLKWHTTQISRAISCPTKILRGWCAKDIQVLTIWSLSRASRVSSQMLVRKWPAKNSWKHWLKNTQVCIYTLIRSVVQPQWSRNQKFRKFRTRKPNLVFTWSSNKFQRLCKKIPDKWISFNDSIRASSMVKPAGCSRERCRYGTWGPSCLKSD